MSSPDSTSTEQIIDIFISLAYFIVLLSIGYYGGRLIYVLISSTSHFKRLHWRVKILILMILITFICFLVRL